MKVKLNYNSITKAAGNGLPLAAGAVAGYVVAEKAGDKANQMLAEKGYTGTNTVYYVGGGKILIGAVVAGLAGTYGKKNDMASQATIGFGVGMAVNGGIDIAKNQNWFGMSGSGMKVRYRKVKGPDGKVIDNQAAVLGPDGRVIDNQAAVLGRHVA